MLSMSLTLTQRVVSKGKSPTKSSLNQLCTGVLSKDHRPQLEHPESSNNIFVVSTKDFDVPNSSFYRQLLALTFLILCDDAITCMLVARCLTMCVLHQSAACVTFLFIFLFFALTSL